MFQSSPPAAAVVLTFFSWTRAYHRHLAYPNKFGIPKQQKKESKSFSFFLPEICLFFLVLRDRKGLVWERQELWEQAISGGRGPVCLVFP